MKIYAGRANMGRGLLTYHYPDSGRDESVALSAFLDYRLDDGSMLHILTQAAYCPNCDRFVVAEEIPPEQELEDEIVRLQAREVDALWRWEFISNGAPVEVRIKELFQRLKWRQKRVSPPRCLECGAPHPIPIPETGDFIHPRTGERVVFMNFEFADMGDDWVAEFSPEGQPLKTSA